MKIQQRACAGLALGIVSICAICIIWLWQQHAQSQEAARQAWRTQLSFVWKQQSMRELHTLEQTLDRFSPSPLQSVVNRDDAIQYFSGTLTSTEPSTPSSDKMDDKLPIPVSILQNWLSQSKKQSGLFATDAQNFQWLVFSPHTNQWHLAMRSAGATVQSLREYLGGDFYLESPWQSNFSCASDMVGTPVSSCSRLEHAIAVPLLGINNHQIAQLVWQPLEFEAHMRSLKQQFMGNVWMVVVAGLTLLLVSLVTLTMHLHPIERGTAALNRLIQGDVHTHIDETHLDAEEEPGQIFHALHAIRHELIQLETLRQERQRLRVQHERLIRTELRKLADNLDSTSRDEILQTLAHQNQSSLNERQHPENTLAELAGVLGRMSGLVSAQQDRLLKLLKELQAAMQTQAMLVSLQQELEIARQMQLSILPRTPPPTSKVHIDALMLPAKEVGGDFYDYFLIDDDHLAVVVADVSGKGVPAAFFMAISRTLLKSNAMHLSSASQTIGKLNDQLCAENDQMMFVTVFYAVLELSTGKLHYVNAGHNPPLLKQQGETTYLQSEKNMALAVLEDQEFYAGELTLQPGDQIIFYTDGVTEATDNTQSLFGEKRLLDAVMQHAPDSAALPDSLLTHIRDFEKGAPQADDITIVALEYLGDHADANMFKT